MATAVPTGVSVAMTRTKTTTRFVRYDAPAGSALENVYVQKADAEKLGNPEQIRVRVEAGR